MEPKKKKRADRAVGILLVLLLVFQIFYVFMNGIVHEITGILFFVLLAVHIVQKKKWLRSLKVKDVPPLQQAFRIVTALLLVAMIVLLVSAVGVSRTVFSFLGLTGSRTLHVGAAAAVLGLTAVHVGLRFAVRARKKRRALILTGLAAAAAVALVLAGVPYLNRHFKTVGVDYEEAVSGPRLAPRDDTLVVYFSRVGNTDFEPDVDAVSGASLMLADGELTGNAQLLAAMTADILGCESRAITVTGERYPSSYGDTVSVGGDEIDAGARPAIEPVDCTGYDRIILVYPIWWYRLPAPVCTFLESQDFSGKTIDLLATQGSSGFAQTTGEVSSLAPGAAVREGLSIYCEDVPFARGAIYEWLAGTEQP